MSRHVVREVALQKRERGFCKAVAPPVVLCRFDRKRVNVHAHGAARTQKQGGDRQNPAAAADIEHRAARAHRVFQCLQAKAGGLVPARAECKSRFERQHRAVLGVFGILAPKRLDEQPTPNGQGMKICFPIVLPVLAFADQRVDLVRNACRRQALRKIGKRLIWARFGRIIQMDARFGTILREQILVNEVDVRDLACFFLKCAVILDINAARRRHARNVCGTIRICRVYRDANFRPVHVFHLTKYAASGNPRRGFPAPNRPPDGLAAPPALFKDKIFRVLRDATGAPPLDPAAFCKRRAKTFAQIFKSALLIARMPSKLRAAFCFYVF